jgi:hypothetical protein
MFLYRTTMHELGASFSAPDRPAAAVAGSNWVMDSACIIPAGRDNLLGMRPAVLAVWHCAVTEQAKAPE